MPDHVHLLLKARKGNPISKIIQNMKKYSAREINILLDRSGTLWQKDYWDQYMRSPSHLILTMRYIVSNPEKSGLISNHIDWPWSWIREDYENQIWRVEL